MASRFIKCCDAKGCYTQHERGTVRIELVDQNPWHDAKTRPMNAGVVMVVLCDEHFAYYIELVNKLLKNRDAKQREIDGWNVTQTPAGGKTTST